MKKQTPRASRWESFVNQRGRAPELPETEGGEHLIEYLEEMGWCRPAGMGGHIPLDWSELNSWQQLTDTPLTTWESLTLRRLSVVYCGQFNKSNDESCPPPWQSQDIDRPAVAQGLKSLTASINASKERGR